MNKKILKSLWVASMFFAAVGCDKDQLGATFTGEGEDAQTAYFAQKTVSESFDANTTGDKVVYVNLLRQSAEGELTVELETTMDEATAQFYEIPESVSFADGEYGVTIPVSISSVENYAPGVTYAAVIKAINPDHEEVDGMVSIASKYGSVTVATTLALVWKPVYTLQDPTKLLSNDLTDADYVVGPNGTPLPQTGTYYYYGILTAAGLDEDPGLTLERAEGTSVFRINHWANDVNVIFSVNPDKKITIDGKEYMTLSVSEQTTGVSSGSEDILFSDAANYTGNPAILNTYPCYWDGEREFAFTLVYYDSEGNWKPETEYFVLDDGSASLE